MVDQEEVSVEAIEADSEEETVEVSEVETEVASEEEVEAVVAVSIINIDELSLINNLVFQYSQQRWWRWIPRWKRWLLIKIIILRYKLICTHTILYKQ